MRRIIITILALGLVAGACTADADVASENISRAADQFEVDRRIVFFNGITDTYLLTIEGRCSLTDDGNELEVTCKAEGAYRKHFLGLSDNVTYFVEHLTPSDVSTDRYRVIFKPESIIPDLDAA